MLNRMYSGFIRHSILSRSLTIFPLNWFSENLVISLCSYLSDESSIILTLQNEITKNLDNTHTRTLKGPQEQFYL